MFSWNLRVWGALKKQTITTTFKYTVGSRRKEKDPAYVTQTG